MIFRYPGGKSKKSVKEKILSYFPKDYKEYREPMVGGGGIYFAIPTDKTRWINDIDGSLIAVYIALRDRPAEFIKKCREIETERKDDGLVKTKKGGNALYNKRMKEKFDYLATATNEDQALRYFFIHRTVYMGRVNYAMESRMYFSNPSGWNVAHSGKMEKAAGIISGTRITSVDFMEPLESDGTDVMVYLDPPYYLNTELSTTSKLYKYNFSKEDHVRLFKAVEATKHKVVISYDDHPEIIGLYKSDRYTINKTQWKYCGTSSAECSKQPTKRNGNELIITNF